jgi:chemotaxis protein methyltransferase CheR
MDNKLFDKFRKLIYEVSGIHLGEQKKALIIGRLSKRIRTLGLSDFNDYYDYVINDKSGKELIKLIDSISTNVTHFFRESDHFDYLREKLIECKESGQTMFRIWSAACSTGEEPYSIAIVATEALINPVDYENSCNSI